MVLDVEDPTRHPRRASTKEYIGAGPYDIVFRPGRPLFPAEKLLGLTILTLMTVPSSPYELGHGNSFCVSLERVGWESP